MGKKIILGVGYGLERRGRGGGGSLKGGYLLERIGG